MKINKEFTINVRPLFFILFLCCALLSCSLNNVLLDIISNYIQDPIENFIGDYVIFKTCSLSYIYLGVKESIIPFIGMMLSVLSLIYLAVFQLLNKQKSKTLIASVVFIFILMFLYICLFIYKYPIYYFSLFILQIIREVSSPISFDHVYFLVSFNLFEAIITTISFITYILVIVSSGIKKGLKTVLTILISFLFVLLIIKFAYYILTYVVYIIHLNTNTPFPWHSNLIAFILHIVYHAFKMLIYHGCAIYMFIMFIKSKDKIKIAYILPYVFSIFVCVVSFIFIIVFYPLYIFIANYIIDFIYQSLIF